MPTEPADAPSGTDVVESGLLEQLVHDIYVGLDTRYGIDRLAVHHLPDISDDPANLTRVPIDTLVEDIVLASLPSVEAALSGGGLE